MDAPAPLAAPEIWEVRRRFPVGTRVRYWPGSRRGAWIVSRTRSLPWMVAGVPVVALVDGPNAAAIGSLEVIEDGDDPGDLRGPSLVSGVPGGRSAQEGRLAAAVSLDRELLAVLAPPAAEAGGGRPLPTSARGSVEDLDPGVVREAQRVVRWAVPGLDTRTIDRIAETLVRNGWTCAS